MNHLEENITLKYLQWITNNDTLDVSYVEEVTEDLCVAITVNGDNISFCPKQCVAWWKSQLEG